jgi:uncharacterized protein with ATP-grasp and redox domains
MRSSLECVPCFIRQALEASRFITDDPAIHEQVVREVLRFVSNMDLNQSPPQMGQWIHRRLRELTASEDPYRALKDRFNRMALGMLSDLREKVKTALDPLSLSVKLAIAGNVIDNGVNSGLTETEAHQAIEQVLDESLVGDIHAFRQAIVEATQILYLADNAGEIVFDRLLIEQLPLESITFAVRGSPVINDATRIDAKIAGLDKLVEVIDNGSDAPGTILPDCSCSFQKRFDQADLIIAKGQGNYETLSDVAKDIFYLFNVKCPVIARDAGLKVGSLALQRKE